MTIKNKQQGYFLILAVIFIFMIGIMGTMMAYILSSRAMLSAYQLNGMKTFYIAESGLEIVTRYLTRPELSTNPARLACSSITGYSPLTNASLLGGTFTATASTPLYPQTTLNGSISATDTTIALTSSSGFATSGRVTIDTETMDYAAVSGNSLIGVTRGVGGTIASTHASGARVGQYQCNININAGIPSIASPIYKRQLQWGVQLQDAWIVGDRSSNTFRFSHWNYPTEMTWSAVNVAGGSSSANLNAISMLSNADGWAVGSRAANSFIFMRWNGSNWALTTLPGACSGQDLLGVSMVSSIQGFAVGARYRPGCSGGGSYRYTILQWDGNNWSLLTPSTSPSIPSDASSVQHLNAVHVIDTNGDGLTNIGFAVGNNGTILHYNGSNWVLDNSGVTRHLTGVYTVSSQEAWAVGNNGQILRWNGVTWSAFASPTNVNLAAISMYDSNGDGLADFGVISGASGNLLVYNGSSWTKYDVGNMAFSGVALFNPDDAWAGGNGGNLYHWNGSSWSSEESSMSVAINALSVVRPASPPTSAWRQVFG